MNPALLLTHFNRISEAPNAIPSLRRFILDLAVRGKLVDQDPRDEPACELLKHIGADKARLVQDGEIKKEKPLPPIEKLRLPFILPSGWVWTRLGYLSRLVTSGSRDWAEFYASEGAIFVRMGNLSRDSYRLRLDNVQRVKPPADTEGARTKLREGDILISITGEVGLLGLIPKDFGDAYINQHTCVVRPMDQLRNRYLPELFRSEFAQNQFDEPQRGLKNSFRLTDVTQLLVPLPPLAEQHRIVAKIDELMALCDRLESVRATRESRRRQLMTASLDRLDNGTNKDAFQSHAAFYLDQLPRLTVNSEQVQQLRQTIVNLGVQGKLVHQDQREEPASQLLKKIEQEKECLVKEGKIRRGRPPIPASADELGFDLKPGWQAAKISQILVELQTGPFGSSLHQSDYAKGGTPVINPASIKNERLVPIDAMAVGPATLERLAAFKLRNRDIVLGRRGEMGRCAVVTEREAGWLCGTGSLILRLPDCVFPRFFVTLIGSPFVRKYLGGSAVGATMQNLNQSILLSMVIGLPPLCEQQRIVAKVDELLAICDRLQEQLATSQTESRRLLEAVLDDALNHDQFSTPNVALRA